MSEYQYYEFRTVNRTLSREEVKEVNTWSSRGNVNSTSATFTYNFGDFKRNPKQCLLAHFDVMLYYANYGCRRMMFRFPKKLVNLKTLQQYDYSHAEDYESSIMVSGEGDYVVIDIEENLEEGFTEWLDCESTLAAVTPLWNDILNGDYSSLYLIWSQFIQGAIEHKMLEKDEIHYQSVPTGLKKLSAALVEFNAFWDIDNDMIAELAQKSPDAVTKNIDYKKAISFLSDSEKSDFLLRFAQNEEYVLQAFLKRLENLNE
jgi:hypothetical protein